MKVIKYSIIVFILLSALLPAQNSIRIIDSTITRDFYTDIPLVGTIEGTSLNELRVELIFDSRIIDIKSASGQTGYAMQETTPEFTIDYKKIDSAHVIIRSTNPAPVNDGIICMLHIRGLVYSDSIAYILPKRLLINGQEVSANFQAGNIKVLGTPVFPIFPDNLSLGYPNPFAYRVRFNFSLKETSSVKFIVYSLNGVRIIDSDNSNGMLEVLSDENNVPINDLNSLKKGGYYVLFTPKFQEIASQYFIFVMKTDRNVFNTNIIYCK